VPSSAWPGLGVLCGTTSRLKNQEVYQLNFSLGQQFTEPGNSGEFPWLKCHSFAVVRAPAWELDFWLQGLQPSQHDQAADSDTSPASREYRQHLAAPADPSPC